jgi:hypothetical protein
VPEKRANVSQNDGHGNHRIKTSHGLRQITETTMAEGPLPPDSGSFKQTGG